MWKKTCKHKWQNYRYKVVEYIEVSNSLNNREGAQILSHVYCTECGEVREVVNEGKRVRFKQIS